MTSLRFFDDVGGDVFFLGLAVFQELLGLIGEADVAHYILFGLSQIAQAILSMLLGALELCIRTGRIDHLIELLQKALKEQTSHLNAETDQEYVRYSIAFEGAFIQCCSNPYITRQYTEIEDLFYLTVLYDQWYIDTVRMLTMMEHRQILNSIIDGDMDKAKTLLTRHYNRFQKDQDH